MRFVIYLVEFNILFLFSLILVSECLMKLNSFLVLFLKLPKPF